MESTDVGDVLAPGSATSPAGTASTVPVVWAATPPGWPPSPGRGLGVSVVSGSPARIGPRSMPLLPSVDLCHVHSPVFLSSLHCSPGPPVPEH